MSVLLIDAGNSTIDFAHWGEDGQINRLGVIAKDGMQSSSLEKILSSQSFDKVWISSVAGSDVDDLIKTSIMGSLGLQPAFAVTQKHQLGLTCCYADVSQLGVDRWLAMLAAWTMLQTEVLVVDCGSAITVDAVDATGMHQGGHIIPGARLMLNSLSLQTANISIDTIDKDCHDKNKQLLTAFGCQTTECAQQGVDAAILAYLNAVMNKAGQCIVTGGDIDKYGKALKPGFIFDRDLVFKGLIEYFRDKIG